MIDITVLVDLAKITEVNPFKIEIDEVRHREVVYKGLFDSYLESSVFKVFPKAEFSAAIGVGQTFALYRDDGFTLSIDTQGTDKKIQIKADRLRKELEGMILVSRAKHLFQVFTNLGEGRGVLVDELSSSKLLDSYQSGNCHLDVFSDTDLTRSYGIRFSGRRGKFNYEVSNEK